MTNYLLDANIFIEANRRYYSFDICPGFWDLLLQFNKSSVVKSIDKVKKELVHGEDELCLWAKRGIPSNFFIRTDDEGTTGIFKKIMGWASSNNFTSAAIAEFAGVADGWLVAHAKFNNFVVVTHEVYKPAKQNKIPIPNICLEFGVKHIDTFEMIRALKAKFVLGIS